MSHDAELVAKVAEALCTSRHGDLGIIPTLSDPDPRMRSAACFGCQRDARAVLDALDLPSRERRAKAEVRRAEWEPHKYDGRNWRFPAEQVAANVVIDGILRDVFQGRRDHLRGQMLDVARRSLGRIEWARDEDIRKAQAEALREAADAIRRNERECLVDKTCHKADAMVLDYRAAEIDPEEGDHE